MAAPTVPTALDNYFASGPPNLTGEGDHTTCSICQRSFESTLGYPTQTLLCGHQYHTMCYYIHQDNAIKTCPEDTCEYPIWDTFNTVLRSINQVRIDAQEEVLQETIQTSPGFTKDLKELKSTIRGVTKAHASVMKLHKSTYNQFIHRNLYTINQLQTELNTVMSNVSSTDEIKFYKKELIKYRKKERFMFRNYHVTFRDLHRTKILNVSWRLRYILERHGASFSRWRYTIRIKPLGKPLRDPIRGDQEV